MKVQLALLLLLFLLLIVIAIYIEIAVTLRVDHLHRLAISRSHVLVVSAKWIYFAIILETIEGINDGGRVKSC